MHLVTLMPQCIKDLPLSGEKMMNSKAALLCYFAVMLYHIITFGIIFMLHSLVRED